MIDFTGGPFSTTETESKWWIPGFFIGRDTIHYGEGMSVADPGFLRWGPTPRGGSANLLFGKIFLENCMKMKEIGPREGGIPGPPWVCQWEH